MCRLQSPSAAAWRLAPARAAAVDRRVVEPCRVHGASPGSHVRRRHRPSRSWRSSTAVVSAPAHPRWSEAAWPLRDGAPHDSAAWSPRGGARWMRRAGCAAHACRWAAASGAAAAPFRFGYSAVAAGVPLAAPALPAEGRRARAGSGEHRPAATAAGGRTSGWTRGRWGGRLVAGRLRRASRASWTCRWALELAGGAHPDRDPHAAGAGASVLRCGGAPAARDRHGLPAVRAGGRAVRRRRWISLALVATGVGGRTRRTAAGAARIRNRPAVQIVVTRSPHPVGAVVRAGDLATVARDSRSRRAAR